MSTKKKSNSNVQTIIVTIFLIGVVLFYFNHINNKASIERTKKQATEVEALTTYDMVGSYPKTPRDVVKLHCRYFKVLYGQEVNDDELVLLNEQIRNLYSTELLKYNTEDANLKELKKNIKKMAEEKYKFKSYILPEASQVQYYTQEGVEMATMEVEITIDMEDSMGYKYLQYVLVKEGEQWKIHAWGDSKMGQTIQ